MNNWNAVQIRSVENALRDSLPDASGLEVTDIVASGVKEWRVSYVFEDTKGKDSYGSEYFTANVLLHKVEDFALVS